MNFVLFAVGAVCAATGILGSCFLLVSFGILMIFRGISDLFSEKKNSIKIPVSVFFAVVSAYLIYYSSLMLFSTLDYAAYRPKIWLVLPISLVFVIIVTITAKHFDDRAELTDENSEKKAFSDKIISSDTELITVFSVVIVGFFGTFLSDFFFEYAASLTVAVCIFSSIANFCGLSKKFNNKQQTITHNNAE